MSSDDDLIAAIRAADINTVRILLQDYTQVTYELVNLAVQGGNLDIIKLFLDKVIDKYRVASMAIHYDHLHVLQHIADSGVVITHLLYIAAWVGNMTIVRWMLENSRQDTPTYVYNSALAHTVSKNHLAIATLLINHGAKIDFNVEWMFQVCMNADCYEMLILLLGTTLSSSDLNSGLATAIGCNKQRYISLFLNHGADIMKLPPDCIHRCCSNGNYEGTKILLQLNYRPDILYNDQYPINLAINLNNCAIVELLIAYGVDIHTCSYMKRAVAANSYEVVQLLLRLGLGVTSDELVSAASRNNIRIFNLLREYGAALSEEILQTIAKCDSADVLQEILDKQLIDIKPDEVFSSAVKQGSHRVARLLYNSTTRCDMVASLVIGAIHGHTEICEFLLSNMKIDEAIIHEVSRRAPYSMIEMMLKRIDHPILKLIEQNDLTRITDLINTGTDITAYRNIYLYVAVSRNRLPMAQLLISNGASIPLSVYKTKHFINTAISTRNIALVKLVLSMTDDAVLKKFDDNSYFFATDIVTTKLLQQYNLETVGCSFV